MPSVGTGKTCSAIAVTEAWLANKRVPNYEKPKYHLLDGVQGRVRSNLMGQRIQVPPISKPNADPLIDRVPGSIFADTQFIEVSSQDIQPYIQDVLDIVNREIEGIITNWYESPDYLQYMTRDIPWGAHRSGMIGGHYSKPTNKSVYDDRQNVHTTTVASTVTESINNLQLDPEPDFDTTLDRILESDLRDTTKQMLTNFCQNESYSRVLAYVWQRISNPLIASTTLCKPIDVVATRTELMRILEERISDCFERGQEVCYNGKVGRLISTLDGFFTDIRITISDSERITAIVLQVRDGLIPYDSETHISLATQALTEAGFEPSQFEAWMEEIKRAQT